MMLDHLERFGRTRPAAPALLAPGRPPMTWSALPAQVAALGRALRAAGVGETTRVAVLLPAGPEAVMAMVAVSQWACCVPFEPAWGGAELRRRLAGAGVTVAIVRHGEPAQGDAPAAQCRAVLDELGIRVLQAGWGESSHAGCFQLIDASGVAVLPAADAPVPRAGDAAGTGLLMQTSGTSTGRPRRVPLSRANLAASAQAIAHSVSLSEDDRALLVLSTAHVHGFVAMALATLCSGGSLVCTPGFDEEAFFGWVAEFRPTWYGAVPAMHQALVRDPSRWASRAGGHRLRFARSASGPLSPATLKRLEAMIDAPVIEAYGMTEAASMITSNRLSPGGREAGTVGWPVSDEVAILDAAGRPLPAGEAGEVAVRGPTVMAAYEYDPDDPRAAGEATHVDGWLRSGDLGCLSADGRLRILGRLAEQINRGGHKVSPRECDDLLLAHPLVQQALCFSMPHPSLGEDLLAAVVLQPGAPAQAEPMLRQWLATQVPDWKVPSRILALDAMPVPEPGGKPRRAALAALLAPRLAARAAPLTTDTERVLAALFEAELAPGEAVDGGHDFFGCGGDSLGAVRLVARINERWGVALTVVDVFERPVLADLAQRIDERRSTAQADPMAELFAALELDH